ncbi:MAG: extracellular solute-binding protein [Clostridia bacterium]|nr:extracellular solute-binding protein [Clostridia bacterium]
MKKKMKKTLMWVLSICMAAGVFSGCGKTDTAESGIDVSLLGDAGGIELPIAEKNVTLKCFIETTVSDLEDKFLFEAIKDITGITIEPVVTTAANATQKLQMLAASKQLPDIGLCYFQDSDRSSLAENGALLCITDSLDIMPNVKKLIETDETYQKAFEHYSEADGKTYIIPSFGIERKINHCMMYRKDIFDEAGIEMWKDGEGFYQALKALKEKYPDCIPFSFKQQFAIVDWLRQQWGLITDCNIDSTGKYVSYMTHEQMKDMLDFLRKLYAEGLMDPEFLTTTQASWTSNMTTDNESFVTFDWVDRMDMFYGTMKETNPEYNLTIANPIGSTGKYLRMNGSNTNSMFIANNENAEISAKMADFLMSEAGAKLTTLGIEGTTYDKTEDKIVYKGFENVLPGTVDLQNSYGMFLAGLSPRFDQESAYFMYTPQVANAQEYAIANDLITEFEFSANIKDSSDKEKYNNIISDMKKEFEIFASNYILGKNNAETAWTDWLAKASEIGVSELEKIYIKYVK